MRICPVLAGLVLVAGAVHADPPKPDVQPAAPQPRPAPVILAAAETPHAPSPDAAHGNPAPSKRSAGRVTTCRCGDPQPETQSPDQ